MGDLERGPWKGDREDGRGQYYYELRRCPRIDAAAAPAAAAAAAAAPAPAAAAAAALLRHFKPSL